MNEITNETADSYPSHSFPLSDSSPSSHPRIRVAILILALLTIGMFADVLVAPRPQVLSEFGTDISSQFLFWRDFGFSELRRGNLALWNPYVFSGMPFFGMFQSALLYPPNWFYLVLPLVRAVNFGIALHVFLLGVFTLLWLSRYRLHPAASLLGAILVMFSGAFFTHVYAGHLTAMCAMAWTPLLLLCVDELFRKISLSWSLVGTFALAMQLLAGHPHHVFYALVTIFLYTALRLLREPRRFPVAICIAAMLAGALALGAVQALAGVAMGKESLRSGGLPIEVAGMMSFPPENFLTMLAPGILGLAGNTPYWGRWYFWETTLFFSVTGLVLAAVGAVRGDRAGRKLCAAMAALLLLLALGRYTPLFNLLYYGVPGFNSTRGNAKFIFYATLFLARLAAGGYDALLTAKREDPATARRLRRIAHIAFGAIFIAFAFMWFLQSHTPQRESGDRFMSFVFHALRSSGEVYELAYYDNPQFAWSAVYHAFESLRIAAFTLLFIAVVFLLGRRRPRALYLLGFLATAEMLVFGASVRKTFDPARARFEKIEQFVKSHPGDFRILQLMNENNTIPARIGNVWGYDPGVPRRYAEFIAFTQGRDPDRAQDQFEMNRFSSLYRMLRCRYFFKWTGSGFQILTGKEPLGRLELVRDVRVEKERDAIFQALAAPDFDPRRTVILESEPSIRPSPSDAGGTATLVDSSTDYLTIEADLPAPAILLVTDAYSRGWRARALVGSAQREYEVIPANYVLRAVPLTAGRHRLRLEYAPPLLKAGKWISLAALILYSALVVWSFRRSGPRKRLNKRWITSAKSDREA